MSFIHKIPMVSSELDIFHNGKIRLEKMLLVHLDKGYDSLMKYYENNGINNKSQLFYKNQPKPNDIIFDKYYDIYN